MSLQHMDVDLTLECEAWEDALPDLEAFSKAICHKTLEFAGYRRPTIEISLVYADDAFVQNLNRDYRGKDTPTNVLSFPQHEPDMISPEEDFLALGDVVMAYETMEREAGEMGISLRAHAAHLLTHGLLHLLGYDHETDADATRMEALEVRVLRAFGIDNPYDEKREIVGFPPR